MENANDNIAVWFEIPATDLERATKFYTQVFDTNLYDQDMGELKMAMFPHIGTSVSGALVKGEEYTPSFDGNIVYLNGGKDLATPLSRVEQSGGKVVMPKTFLGDGIGYIALFNDCEGNRIGLHSMS